MSGIYLHIPFCKKRCHYCDFYSTTQVKQIPVLTEALTKELVLRKNYLPNEAVETVYFGGGTPSLIEPKVINEILSVVVTNFCLVDHAEITLEANPDDLTDDYLRNLSQTPVNRLSIGIQSFDDTQLTMMNRRHNAQQAIDVVERCKKNGFNNLSIDLIYGLPGMNTNDWKNQLEKARKLDVPHISAYHLTYEKGTVFESRLRKKELSEISEDDSLAQLKMLIEWAKKNGYEHYEISNFARNGQYSKHNTSYWQQKPYLGIGPAAHSYNISTRSWNISNLNQYLEGIKKNQPHIETEVLTETDRFNDYIITALRTCWGIDVGFVKKNFEPRLLDQLLGASNRYLNSNQLILEKGALKLSESGIFISNQIMEDLICLNNE